MKVITKTTIQWKPTLLGLKIGEVLEIKNPLGMPNSLSSTASRLRTSGAADFSISIKDGIITIKRIA